MKLQWMLEPGLPPVHIGSAMDVTAAVVDYSDEIGAAMFAAVRGGRDEALDEAVPMGMFADTVEEAKAAAERLAETLLTAHERAAAARIMEV